MRNIIAAAALVVALSGCVIPPGPPRPIALMSRTDSNGGSGQMTRGTTVGDIAITIGARTYAGQWVAEVEEATTSVQDAFNPFAQVSATTTGSSNGNALLRSPDGGSLRCAFRRNGAGFGVCQDGDGRVYDMQIR